MGAAALPARAYNRACFA